MEMTAIIYQQSGNDVSFHAENDPCDLTGCIRSVRFCFAFKSSEPKIDVFHGKKCKNKLQQTNTLGTEMGDL